MWLVAGAFICNSRRMPARGMRALVESCVYVQAEREAEAKAEAVLGALQQQLAEAQAACVATVQQRDANAALVEETKASLEEQLQQVPAHVNITYFLEHLCQILLLLFLLLLFSL